MWHRTRSNWWRVQGDYLRVRVFCSPSPSYFYITPPPRPETILPRPTSRRLFQVFFTVWKCKLFNYGFESFRKKASRLVPFLNKFHPPSLTPPKVLPVPFRSLVHIHISPDDICASTTPTSPGSCFAHTHSIMWYICGSAHCLIRLAASGSASRTIELDYVSVYLWIFLPPYQPIYLSIYLARDWMWQWTESFEL